MDKKFIEQSGETTKVKLSGKLDAVNAPVLMEELRSLAGQNVKNIVFYAESLEYISSAGLRTIIFAKQKLGKDIEVYMIGAQEAVSDVIKMSGLDNFLYLQDSYED